MNVAEAIDRACAEVGIRPPRAYKHGQWAKCDTLEGKSGKGDGRVNVDDLKVTAFNWKLGQSATIWLKNRDSLTHAEKRQFAERRAKDEADQRERAARAAYVAEILIGAAKLGPHPYLVRKGFQSEHVLVVPRAAVIEIGGQYLVPDGAREAILLQARHDHHITSAQLIWEDGTKKFLAGGEMGGASHRISRGSETWLCEGFATGLSLRAALKALNRSATVLCCFSASNIATVARSVDGKCFVAADNDKPLEQFGGKGTGEHYAEASGKPYLMPLVVGTDFNDMHMSDGIFAVQRSISAFLRSVRSQPH